MGGSSSSSSASTTSTSTTTNNLNAQGLDNSLVVGKSSGDITVTDSGAIQANENVAGGALALSNEAMKINAQANLENIRSQERIAEMNFQTTMDSNEKMQNMAEFAIDANENISLTSIDSASEISLNVIDKFSSNSAAANKYAHDIAIDSMKFADNITRSDATITADKTITMMGLLGGAYIVTRALK